MRIELLYNPRALCERLAIESGRRRRLAKLQNTPGRRLSLGHIDSLELLEIAASLGIGVIYDIGASVGTWSVLAKSVVPQAKVHAFEPLPKHQEQFADNVGKLNDVTLHRIALGQENSNAVLHVTDFSDATSLLPLAAASQVSQLGVREVARISTPIWRLDDYRTKHHLATPDLLKLDVQGYELEVLKGGSNCLQTAKAVIAEVSFIEYYENQCFFHHLVNYLADFGLFVRAFGINTPLASEIEQTDVLFARRHI